MNRPTIKEVNDAIKILKAAVKSEMLYDGFGNLMYDMQLICPEPDVIAKILEIESDKNKFNDVVYELNNKKIALLFGF